MAVGVGPYFRRGLESIRLDARKAGEFAPCYGVNLAFSAARFGLFFGLGARLGGLTWPGRRATQVGKRHDFCSSPVNIIGGVVRFPEGALFGLGEFVYLLEFLSTFSPSRYLNIFSRWRIHRKRNHREGVVILVAGAGGNTVIRPSDKITTARRDVHPKFQIELCLKVPEPRNRSQSTGRYPSISRSRPRPRQP